MKELWTPRLMDTNPEVETKSSELSALILNNFALTSAAITTLIACVVMAFLYSYLSVFDGSLIWIVEYTDIIKFCLVGFALISGTVFTLFNVFDIVRKWTAIEERNKKIIAYTAFGFFFVVLAVGLLSDYLSDNTAI